MRTSSRTVPRINVLTYQPRASCSENDKVGRACPQRAARRADWGRNLRLPRRIGPRQAFGGALGTARPTLATHFHAPWSAYRHVESRRPLRAT